MASSLSAQATPATYGDLLQDAYGWKDGHANGGERTGFNPGPSPDRPDVLWRSDSATVIYNVSRGIYGDKSDYGHPVAIDKIGTSPNGMVAMDKMIILTSTVRPYGNSTTRAALQAVDPFTGNVIWTSLMPQGASVGSPFGADYYIDQVDATHFITNGGGVVMWNINGTMCWYDVTINPSAAYNSKVVEWDAARDLHMEFGPQGTTSTSFGSYPYNISSTPIAWRGSYMRGWDLSNPEVDKGPYGRSSGTTQSPRQAAFR